MIAIKALSLALLFPLFLSAQAIYHFPVRDIAVAYDKIIQDKNSTDSLKASKLKDLLYRTDSSFYKELFRLDFQQPGVFIEQIKRAKPLHKDIALLAKKFRKDFKQAVDAAAKLFPQVRSFSNEVHFVPTLFQVNGQFRLWGNRWVLIYGIDALAEDQQKGFQLKTTLIHEMIHLVNSKGNDSITRLVGQFYQNPMSVKLPLFYHLYIEGLAVYLTNKIDSTISIDQSLMQTGLRNAADKNSRALADSVRAVFYSTELNDVADFFWLNGTKKGVPVKTGYYIGYLLVKDMATRMTNEQLIALYGRKLENELQTSFKSVFGITL